MAAEAGADAFKTQAYTTNALIAPSLPEWRERLRAKEVSFAFIEKMKERCDRYGLTFMCTAHDLSVLPWLEELHVPAFKVGSGERGNIPFLRELAKYGKPMILSTGMYEEKHLLEAISALSESGLGQLALLHCVTSYPTPITQINLRAMDRMRELFNGPIGYSDHTSDHRAVFAAVARGAAIIEKHITLDFNIPNAQDWKVSCGPEDLTDFIKGVRDVEVMLGSRELTIQECEQPALNWALKSLVAAKSLPAKTIIEPYHLNVMRPGSGLPPSMMEFVLGRRLKNSLHEGDPLQWDNLEEEP
jgi:N-acetylneuraminate synthase/N,N'-diacetyllegionaminate synthase